MVVADLHAAVALAGFGERASGAIEAEIRRIVGAENALERRGLYRTAVAYAAIRGERALPFLRGVEADLRDGGMPEYVDDAMATAMGLTSYVSRRRPVSANIPCIRGFQPRDALDRLILGLLRGDREWLESGLNVPSAGFGREKWNRLLDSSGWLHSSEPAMARLLAVGYRFQRDDRWSAPPIKLLIRQDRPEPEESGLPIPTRFYDAGGILCAEVPVYFHRNRDGAAFRPFVVGQENVGDVLQAILRCGR